jgi:hypothetical protein
VRLLAPSLPSFQLKKPKIPYLVRTATYWKNFTSSYKRHKKAQKVSHSNGKWCGSGNQIIQPQTQLALTSIDVSLKSVAPLSTGFLWPQLFDDSDKLLSLVVWRNWSKPDKSKPAEGILSICPHRFQQDSYGRNFSMTAMDCFHLFLGEQQTQLA